MAENVKNEKDYFASLFDPEDKNYIFSQYEDIGDLQKAQYFRQMYEKGVHQYPLRKSGVRALAVPRL